MKKGTKITLISVAVVLVLLIIVTITSYNGLVDKEEAINKAASQIDNQLTRRESLIPNLVEVVKGYSKHEQSTFLAVTEARAAVNEATDPVEKAEASAQLDTAIDVWVNSVAEAYPELKADKEYEKLHDDLSGTENRIATARKDYIDAVNEYNASIRRFPGNIFASIFGFEQVEYFEASESANQVPQVSFD